MLHDQTLDKVTRAKYLGIEITENLHWEKHIQATAVKANKVSAFAYRNLKGSQTDVQTHCYNSLVRLVLEYSEVVWDPTSNILNPHWRWYNDAQLVASFTNPAALLEPSNRSSRGHQAKLQIPQSRTDTYLYTPSFFPS